MGHSTWCQPCQFECAPLRCGFIAIDGSPAESEMAHHLKGIQPLAGPGVENVSLMNEAKGCWHKLSKRQATVDTPVPLWSRQAHEASRASRHTRTVIKHGIYWPQRVLCLSTPNEKWRLHWGAEWKVCTLLKLRGKKHCWVWRIIIHTGIGIQVRGKTWVPAFVIDEAINVSSML